MRFLKKHLHGFLFWAVVVFSVLFFTQPLFATTELEINKKMAEMEEITKAIEQFEKLYDQKKKEGSQVLSQIRQLENSINGLEQDVTSLEKQINVTEVLLGITQQEREKAQVSVNERTVYYQGRLNQIYQQGDISFLEVLLQATSLTDFLTRFDLLQKIAEDDHSKLKKLEQARQHLLQKEASFQEQIDSFNFLKKQKEQKNRQMELQSRQKNNLLKTIEKQKGEYSISIKELDQVRESIDAFIREWQVTHQEAYMGSGKMGWPLPGHTRITSGFGYRIHPIFKTRSFHPAIDIAAPTGTIVRASENGRVLYVGNKGGYGQAIILDHGGDVSTQYSHLSAYLVKAGDFVLKGDPIGKVGSTGWSTGPHLDFIIRVKGEPQSPLNYVKP